MGNTGDSRKNKQGKWQMKQSSRVASWDQLFLIPPEEITGWGEGGPSTCPILLEGPSSQTGRTVVVLFASRTPLPLWASPNWVVPRSSGILPLGNSSFFSPSTFQEQLGLPRVTQQSHDVNLGSIIPEPVLLPQSVCTASLTVLGSDLFLLCAPSLAPVPISLKILSTRSNYSSSIYFPEKPSSLRVGTGLLQTAAW